MYIETIRDRPRIVAFAICLAVLTPLVVVSYRGTSWWIHVSAVVGLAWVFPLLIALAIKISRRLTTMARSVRPTRAGTATAVSVLAIGVIGMLLLSSLLILDEVLRAVSVRGVAAWFARLLQPDRGVLLLTSGVAFLLLVYALPHRKKDDPDEGRSLLDEAGSTPGHSRREEP